MFKTHFPFSPIPPQREAVENLAKGIESGLPYQVLLGVTGSGKTAVMAWTIEKVKLPTLVISHNKVLAAQLYQEFKEAFPENAVHYFVSYYDYYQPEAYLPETDTYIEKDAKINEIIDRLRHEAVQSLFTRNDVIIVASVSCIYNIGSPEFYQKISLTLKKGQRIGREEFLMHLVRLQYQREEIDFKPGSFRIRGNFIEIFSPTGKSILKISIEKNVLKRIFIATSKENEIKSGSLKEIEEAYLKFKPHFEEIDSCKIFPAKFWISPEEKLELAISNIKLELQERLKELKKAKKFLEAERLKKRTLYDLEMIKETGWCHGIENYSRHLEFREPGEPPFTLLDYFPKDFLVFIDESHMTIPQLKAMYRGDRQRKETLIEYGFRLPSALDNRPLKFEEFIKKVNKVVFVSATPGPYEMQKVKKGKAKLVELLIRPTGLLDPKIDVRPATPKAKNEKSQVEDLICEIQKAVKNNERVLVITLTKRLAEELSSFLEERGIKVTYLHSEIKTLERPDILKKLRLGEYDVIVGINLLREGLDLPEVALVAILDADKEGFLRNETTLIQTMGRAARHPNGRVILYADKITSSMKKAIKEVERRRKIQMEYNKKHGIIPKGIQKPIREWEFGKRREIEGFEELAKEKDLNYLKREMKKAVANLDFEKAAFLRDQIRKLEAKN